jgi:serine/threonine protein kinase
MGVLTKIRPPRLREGQFLGRGAFKKVVVSTRRGTLVAIATSLTGKVQWKEIFVMILLTRLHPHRNLLPLLAVEYDALLRARMVIPIARYGSLLDLQDHLEFEGCETAFTEEHLREVLSQVESALSHLDTLGLDHADVAARNVLVFEFAPGHPVKESPEAAHIHTALADFGSVVRIPESASARRSKRCALLGLEHEVKAEFTHLAK